MTAAAELSKLVECTGFTAALREWAEMRSTAIDFNHWQKGNSELRNVFLDDPAAKKDAADLNTQVVHSWKSTMQEVHGSGWRRKLNVPCAKKKKSGPSSAIPVKDGDGIPASRSPKDITIADAGPVKPLVANHVPDPRTRLPHAGDTMLVVKRR